MRALLRSLASCAALPLLAAAPAPLTLPAEVPIVSATLNGAPVRLRVAFDAAGILFLSPDAARRARLVPAGASTVLVGPIHLAGKSAVTDLALGGAHRSVHVLWNDRRPDPDPAVDGIVSPASLPASEVRLVRAAAPAGAMRTIAGRADPVMGLIVASPLGPDRIAVRLAPARAETIATAAAGAALAARLGGTVSQSNPPDRAIAFAVSRPVALLSLGRPLAVAGFSLDRLLVRTADFAGATPLPHELGSADSDEIVVMAPESGRPRLRLTLGADLLGRCREIAWRAAPRAIRLDCP